MNGCVRLLAGIAIVLAAALAARAQSAEPLPAPIPTGPDDLENAARAQGASLIPSCRFAGARCGYLDRSGKTVIAPQFDWVDLFVGDRALVGSGGKYGAIDTTGRYAVAPTYASMSRFDRGLALVVVGNRLGAINEDGRAIVPAEHGAIIRIADEAFLVAEPPYAVGRQPDPLGRNVAPYAYGKRWGIVASGGSWIVRPSFAQVSMLSEDPIGLFFASDSMRDNVGWQLIRADGSPVNTERFDHVQLIQRADDRAIVQRGGRWGAVNGKGDIAIDLKFDWLGYFRDGWAPYRLAGREGRIDRDGNILSDAVAQPPSWNGKVGAVVDGKLLYTDRAGTVLLGTDHPKCPDGRHLRFEQGNWTILTADDTPAPAVAFRYVQLACNGPSVVQYDNKWGFISVDGKLLAGRYFDRAQAFHDGIATIVDNGLWAVIGEDGSPLLGPLKLARGTATSGTGVYSIEFEEGYRTLDKALLAELVRDPSVLTHRLAPRLPWSEGLAAQLDDKTGRWGFIDATKNFVIAPQFDAVSPFHRGSAWAAFPDRREWCSIDKAGNIVSAVQCRCGQPIMRLEHYTPPPNVACYDDGIRIVRGMPVIRGTAH
ncbi:WG repeat-containing protein [Bradyrhizobium sp. Y36]|uniref:WG repeat-containing protein n=1 Tax=Bradyrhizobium sp. Y36 TaxID=2035447 RepID=UPI001177CC2A|nr:WG repeat-containing protein [Bradyrhizobium sp. Y36]